MKIFKWVSGVIILGGLLYTVFGCTYGTYYAPGSHANDDTSQHKCERK